jgi:sugar/nucleoside kinase (ribokinase family)
MPGKKYKVLGIGNAIVDIAAGVEDDFIERLNLKKGTMMIVDEPGIKILYSSIKAIKEVSGGSVANTIAALSLLGNKVAFIGKVGNDPLGESFRKDLENLRVDYLTVKAESILPTACCIVLTTPDAQRTMSTYLGVSGLLDPEDIDEDSISQSEIIYLEGYLCDSDRAKEALSKARRIALKSGGKVALSLSDSFCVERHRDDFLKIIKEEISILFANEEEIKSLFKSKSLEVAISRCTELKNICVITRAEKGSLIVSGGEVREIPAQKSPAVIDTTGAGDLYAAGFLHGLVRGMNLEVCGKMGSIIAAEILKQFGARLEISSIRLLNEKGF